MRERCSCCGHKLKKRVFDEPFGVSTIDELAQEIYAAFHGHDALSDEPWPLFSNQDSDAVVAEFRNCAYAAAAILHGAEIGTCYGR